MKTFDAVVLGAGVSGSACARELAQSGLTTALIGPDASQDIVHLTPTATDLLRDVGIDAGGLPGSWSIGAASLVLRTGRAVDIWAERPAIGCRRDAVVEALQDGVGANLCRLRGHVTSITGVAPYLQVQVRTGASTETLRAGAVVVATGRSPLELGIDLGSVLPGAVCTTVVVAAVGSRATGFQAHLPLDDGSVEATSATYGWVHGAEGSDEVTLGLVTEVDVSDSRRTNLLVALARRVGVSGGAVLSARVRSTGAVRSDFLLERSGRAGVLVVGDSLGVANAFTGEGISYALESGVLAASCIHEGEPSGSEPHRLYGDELAARFVGEQETAQWGRRRVSVGWRVLADTADDDSPFVTKVRRAMLSPSGLQSAAAVHEDLREPDPRDAVFLRRCDVRLLDGIRRDWPFLARTAQQSMLANRIRPARLVLRSARAVGCESDSLVSLAVAAELAVLASVVGLTAQHQADAVDDTFSWGRNVSVLSGDFLLAHSFREVTRVGPEAGIAFAAWLHDLVASRRCELRGDGVPGPDSYFALLYSFPATMAALTAGVDDEQVRALSELGSFVGQLFVCRDDLAALTGRPTRLEASLRTMTKLNISHVPHWMRTAGLSGDPNDMDLVARETVIGLGTSQLAELTDRARAIAGSLGGRRDHLTEVVDSVVGPAAWLDEGRSVTRMTGSRPVGGRSH